MVTNGLVNQSIQVDRFNGKNNYVLNKQKPQTQTNNRGEGEGQLKKKNLVMIYGILVIEN